MNPPYPHHNAIYGYIISGVLRAEETLRALSCATLDQPYSMTRTLEWCEELEQLGILSIDRSAGRRARWRITFKKRITSPESGGPLTSC